MNAMAKRVSSALGRAGRFVRDWLVPGCLLLMLATADGVIRSFALLVFGLVVLARVLIVASELAQRHAPQPRRRAARADRGAAA